MLNSLLVSAPESCPNCRRVLPENPISLDGVIVCDFICAQGRENGKRMEETIALGIKWVNFFKEMGIE